MSKMEPHTQLITTFLGVILTIVQLEPVHLEQQVHLPERSTGRSRGSYRYNESRLPLHLHRLAFDHMLLLRHVVRLFPQFESILEVSLPTAQLLLAKEMHIFNFGHFDQWCSCPRTIPSFLSSRSDHWRTLSMTHYKSLHQSLATITTEIQC